MFKDVFTPNFFLNAVFLYCLAVIYVIPYGISTYFYMGPILVVLALFVLFKNRDLLWQKINIFYIGFLGYSAIFKNGPMFGTVLLLIFISLFSKKKLLLYKQNFPYYYFIIFISIVWQMLLYRFDGHPVMSVAETNPTGCFLLLFYFFCRKNKFLLGELFCLGCVFIIITRNYFYALLLVNLFLAFNNIKFWKQFWTKHKFPLVTLIVALNICLIMVSEVFFREKSLVLGAYQNQVVRLVRPIDFSSIHRFKQVNFYVDRIKSDINRFWFGEDKNYYQLYDENVSGPIHNSLIAILAKFGLFWVLGFLFIVHQILKDHLTLQNIPYFIAHSFFSLFLWAQYETQLILLALCLFIMPVKKGPYAAKGFLMNLLSKKKPLIS